jgi:hypothetical protein
MKLLITVGGFLPSIGGTQYSIKYLVREVLSKGHEIMVMTSNEGRYSERETINGINIVRVPYLLPSDLFKVWKHVIKEIKFYSSFDAILCFDHSFLWTLPVRIIYRLPSIVSWNGYELADSIRPTTTRFRVARYIEELFANEAVCGGVYLKKYYWTKATRFYTWPPLLVEDVDFSSKDTRCIFAGRLADDTSILSYLECLAILKETYGVNLPLDIYGFGPLEQSVKDYIRSKNLDANFFGLIDRAYELFPKYKFAFLTQWGAMITAMACKCIIVSICPTQFKIDVTSEVLKDSYNGIMCRTPTEAARILKACLDKPSTFMAIIDNAYKYATSQTWETRTNWFLDIVSSHLKKRYPHNKIY